MRVESAEVDGGRSCEDLVDEVFEAGRINWDSSALVGGVDFDEDVPCLDGGGV